MKKGLLSFSVFLGGIMSVNAQITITTADVAVPNKLIYQSQDTVPTVSAGSAGTSQTWNMSALLTHTVDTLNFIGPSLTGDVTTFPSANLAVKNGSAPAYAYALNSSSSLTVLGNKAEMNFGGTCGTTVIRQYNTPSEILINFPSNYLSSFNNNFASEATFCLGIDPGIGFVIDSVRQKSVITKTNTCDAWGNITTPLGTFASLRFMEVRYNTDSTWIYAFGMWNFFQEAIDSSKKYIWWANSVGFPIVETTVDFTTGAVTRAQWLQALPAAGMNELNTAAALNVYPNPAQDVVYMETGSGEISYIRISDVTGRLIEDVRVEHDLLSIRTADYPNGTYLYTAFGKNNAVRNRGKFSIAR